MKNTTEEILHNLIIRIPGLEALRKDIIKAFETLLNCYLNDGKILVCGNGGSAADSDHLVGELMKGFRKRRKITLEEQQLFSNDPDIYEKLQQTIPAISLCAHTALISAYSNDVDPNMIFAQQVYGYFRSNDVLIGLSTSGNSTNVINAIKVANALGGKTVGITGAEGGLIKELCEISICVPAVETYLIQELYLPIYHALCAMLEEELFYE